MAKISLDLGRQIGLIIDRRGQVEKVVVGESQRLYLPDLGRVRSGQRRLRGLRLVRTQLPNNIAGLSSDDLSDLQLLRLDMVAIIAVTPAAALSFFYYAYLDPESADGYQTEKLLHLNKLDLDFLSFIQELEARRSKWQAAAQAISGPAAILIHVGTHGRSPAESSLKELEELAATAGMPVVGKVIQLRDKPDPRYLMGRGKLEETVLLALSRGAEYLIFDHSLTPSQCRAIGASTELKILDRTQLILTIFAKRAASKEGKLQVELAELKYLLPRLSMKDDALSRLSGGANLRGPGETKLEIARRRLRERLTRLTGELAEISRRRTLRRKARKRAGVPIIAIVGYTNAGKSTLLNTLTGAKVLAENQLFVTLEPACRRAALPDNKPVIYTDTVGFIRELPEDLERAFKATLEEIGDASLIIHLIDRADNEWLLKSHTVLETLRDLGYGDIPLITVYNKVDLLPPAEYLAVRSSGVTAISAAGGQGLSALQNELLRLLTSQEDYHV